ncbi:hypothetical protein NL676_010685 [Syzygium grande]|nr:hypothetical protein NL676_010685 [Syzygium grande]
MIICPGKASAERCVMLEKIFNAVRSQPDQLDEEGELRQLLQQPRASTKAEIVLNIANNDFLTGVKNQLRLLFSGLLIGDVIWPV